MSVGVEAMVIGVLVLGALKGVIIAVLLAIIDVVNFVSEHS